MCHTKKNKVGFLNGLLNWSGPIFLIVINCKFQFQFQEKSKKKNIMANRKSSCSSSPLIIQILLVLSLLFSPGVLAKSRRPISVYISNASISFPFVISFSLLLCLRIFVLILNFGWVFVCGYLTGHGDKAEEDPMLCGYWEVPTHILNAPLCKKMKMNCVTYALSFELWLLCKLCNLVKISWYIADVLLERTIFPLVSCFHLLYYVTSLEHKWCIWSNLEVSWWKPLTNNVFQASKPKAILVLLQECNTLKRLRNIH